MELSCKIALVIGKQRMEFCSSMEKRSDWAQGDGKPFHESHSM